MLSSLDRCTVGTALETQVPCLSRLFVLEKNTSNVVNVVPVLVWRFNAFWAILRRSLRLKKAKS